MDSRRETYNRFCNLVIFQLGTYHGADLFFTFGWPLFYLYDNEVAYNHSMINQRNSSDFERTSTDGAVADFMMTLWTNFAKFGQVFFVMYRIFFKYREETSVVGKANKTHISFICHKNTEVTVLSEAMEI